MERHIISAVDADRGTRQGSRGMYADGLGASSAQFRWAVGIENTFVPHTRAGHRRLDQYELMDHYRLWRADIDRAADLGISAIRYGIPWYRVNPRPGHYDWSWTDAVLEYLAVDRGLTPIVDLLHYGTPLWLDNQFVNASYSRRVAEYAARFAERYAGLARFYTPANEPSVTANFCGRDGRWPPYLSGEDGYVKVLLSLLEGVNRTAEVIRSIRPDAVLVHVEDVGLERPGSARLTAAAADAQSRRLLALDLACGHVVPGHPRYDWLREHGTTEAQLAALAADAPDWDILGVNFYPWSSRRLIQRRGGRVHSVADSPAAALADVLRLVHARYGRPLMVTETSSAGTHVERANWMRGTVEAVRQVRSEGLPVLGYTWFPLYTMIEWKYRWSRKGLQDHLLHLGLYDVPDCGAAMAREETPLVAEYRGLIANAGSAVGECGTATPLDPPSLVA